MPASKQHAVIFGRQTLSGTTLRATWGYDPRQKHKAREQRWPCFSPVPLAAEVAWARSPGAGDGAATDPYPYEDLELETS